jgi:predicted dehydrogenase
VSANPVQRPCNVGIIGGGLMGREVASAIARWPALLDHPVKPRLTAVCDVDERARDWFDRIETVTTKVADYHDLLADGPVDVVYVAVRHDLHEDMYTDVVRSGKGLLGEKPFGIDLASALRIVETIEATPGAFVRCSSELPFLPAAQEVVRTIRSGQLGEVIEVVNTFGHSSDFDLTKPISWKRQSKFCGKAGVMNDLGMHVAHLPLRFGWFPQTVYAILQDLVPSRPDSRGLPAPCDTFENATLIGSVGNRTRSFPMRLEMKRLDPGQMNTWAISVQGMSGSVAYSTRQPKTVRLCRTVGARQDWQEIEAGSQSVFATVTGSIFEAGFSDAVLQMVAAFLAEWDGQLGDRFGCVTPHEALDSHRIWDAALRSNATGTALPTDQAARRS